MLKTIDNKTNTLKDDLTIEIKKIVNYPLRQLVFQYMLFKN